MHLHTGSETVVWMTFAPDGNDNVDLFVFAVPGATGPRVSEAETKHGAGSFEAKKTTKTVIIH